MLFSPTTFVRLKTFVDSAMNSSFMRSRSGKRREYRMLNSDVRGARRVFRPMNSGRWNARRRRRVAVQHPIAPHVEYVAALNRGDHRKDVAVYQISEHRLPP